MSDRKSFHWGSGVAISRAFENGSSYCRPEYERAIAVVDELIHVLSFGPRIAQCTQSPVVLPCIHKCGLHQGRYIGATGLADQVDEMNRRWPIFNVGLDMLLDSAGDEEAKGDGGVAGEELSRSVDERRDALLVHALIQPIYKHQVWIFSISAVCLQGRNEGPIYEILELGLERACCLDQPWVFYDR